jgi:hypothetical protein
MQKDLTPQKIPDTRFYGWVSPRGQFSSWDSAHAVQLTRLVAIVYPCPYSRENSLSYIKRAIAKWHQNARRANLLDKGAK